MPRGGAGAGEEGRVRPRGQEGLDAILWALGARRGWLLHRDGLPSPASYLCAQNPPLVAVGEWQGIPRRWLCRLDVMTRTGRDQGQKNQVTEVRKDSCASKRTCSSFKPRGLRKFREVVSVSSSFF